MYKLKQIPEDFIVKEIPNKDFTVSKPGRYAYFLLKKRDYTTMDALQVLSRRFKLPLKNFGFAGNKDRKAETGQYISILYSKKGMQNINFYKIKLKYICNGNKPISLGDLIGNEFLITIRNLTMQDINKLKTYENNFLVPNYFGSQRFSENNYRIGRAMIKRNFKAAVEMMSGGDKGIISSYLQEKPTDYIGALRNLPLQMRRMYIHSYQSILFNKTLWQFLKSSKIGGRFSFENNKKIKNFFHPQITVNFFIPVIGFGFEINKCDEAIKKIVKKIIIEERISTRDFIISSIPELSSEGAERRAFAEVKDFKIIKIESDELNKNKKKIKTSFSLDKGSYATAVVDYILENCKNIIKDFI